MVKSFLALAITLPDYFTRSINSIAPAGRAHLAFVDPHRRTHRAALALPCGIDARQIVRLAAAGHVCNRFAQASSCFGG